jgi:hypothetical protein
VVVALFTLPVAIVAETSSWPFLIFLFAQKILKHGLLASVISVQTPSTSQYAATAKLCKVPSLNKNQDGNMIDNESTTIDCLFDRISNIWVCH